MPSCMLSNSKKFLIKYPFAQHYKLHEKKIYIYIYMSITNDQILSPERDIIHLASQHISIQINL